MNEALKTYVISDLKRRAGFVAADVDTWRADIKEAVKHNQNSFGLHLSQFHDIETFWSGASERRERVANLLKPGVKSQIFFDKLLELGRIVAGSSALLDFYKNVFAQREDAQFKAALEDADLVAASCYQPCINRALGWGAIADLEVRTPPITVLTGELAATAGTRQHRMLALPTASNLQYFQETLLPIPFVFLPFDHAHAHWTLTSIHHEVGHILTQDMGLLKELPAEIENALVEVGASDERRRLWQSWLYEIIADTFGILLAGVSYARLLLQLLMRSPAEVKLLNEADPHPSHFVRICFLCTLLRRTGLAPMKAGADEVEALWTEVYTEPDWAADFIKDGAAVADLMLNKKLARLKGHALLEFAPDLEEEHAAIRDLARALKDNFNYPAVTEQTFSIYRLLPPAALASVSAGAGLDDVQARVRLYLQGVAESARPDWLDAPAGPAEHDSFVKDLAEKLDFGVFGG